MLDNDEFPISKSPGLDWMAFRRSYTSQDLEVTDELLEQNKNDT